jgi:hypothetical protein
MANLTPLSNSCTSVTGGVYRIYLAKADQITSMDLSGTHYNNITFVDGGESDGTPALIADSFELFEFEMDQAEYRQNISRENGAYAVEHEVEFFTKGWTEAQRVSLDELMQAGCGLVAIVVNRNAPAGTNDQWVVGYSENFGLLRPLYLESDSLTSGREFTDQTGSTVVLKSMDNERARRFVGTIPVV